VTAPLQNVCALLQEVGFPAVRVKPLSADVLEANDLFSALVSSAPSLETRTSFVRAVLPGIARTDKNRWEAAFVSQTSTQVEVAFKSADESVLIFEMRSFASRSSEGFGQSLLCVFIPLASPILGRICDAYFSEGQELERTRIRDELHREISQQLLGAAFGCKVLAGKVAALSTDLGKEASELADLVNEAVIELQNLVHSSQNQS
jgi:hypothetical protein